MSTAHKLPLDAPLDDLGYNTIDDRKTPELVFAFVEPIGGGASHAAEALKRALQAPSYGYEINEISMSELLSKEASKLNIEMPELHPSLQKIGPNISGEAKRINELQQLGNELRKRKNFDFLAKKTIQAIATYRDDNGGYQKATGALAPVAKPLRVAHIIRSLKHGEELKLLKAVYGNLFFLIGVSGNYEQQLMNYMPLTKSTSEPEIVRIEKEYKALSKIDQYEGIKNGQQVRKVFYKADLFLKSNKTSIDENIASFLELLFGMKIGCPTIDERMMFEAFAASLRSTCLSRQVGAAIADEKSELISVGWNDIPAFGGGLALDSNPAGKKALCKSIGKCRSTVEINSLLTKLYEELIDKKLLKKTVKKEKVVEALSEAGISELIEFSRAIHAEMEALLSAGRTGKNGNNLCNNLSM